jgi:hypothetical protein
MNSALKQRLDALNAANEIRSYRSKLKAQIKVKAVTVDQVAELLLEPPEQLESMQVAHLVKAVPGVGKTKVANVMKNARLPMTITIAGAGKRRLRLVCDQLARWR